MKSQSEALVSREIPGLFPEHSLVEVNKILPGKIHIDFHFRGQTGTNIFLNISAQEIDHKKLGQIINLYTAILNIAPPLKKFELIIVCPKVAKRVQDQVESLPIKLITYDEIGISPSLLKQSQLSEKQRLSPREASLITRWESENRTTIRASDVQKELGCTRNYAYFLLHNLERKNWIERVMRGLYQFIPLNYGYPDRILPADPFIIATRLVEPYYCSYYTSNSYYGFTTQMPFTVYIATLKKKQRVEWLGGYFKFVTLSKKKFFGYNQVVSFDTEILMAEPEKSIVDSFDKPRYTGGIEHLTRITWRALPKLKREKLVEYALRMKSHSLVQRMGLIIDFLSGEGLVEPLSSDLREQLLMYVGKTTIYLDSNRETTGKYNKDWKIINNIPKNQLLSEIEIQ